MGKAIDLGIRGNYICTFVEDNQMHNMVSVKPAIIILYIISSISETFANFQSSSQQAL